MRSSMDHGLTHLYNCANVLPESQSCSILKVHFLTKCRLLENRKDVSFPRWFNKSAVRCPRCCIEYNQSVTSCHIEPEQKKSRFIKKLLKKDSQNEFLTRYQTQRLTTLRKKGKLGTSNNLVITCGTCKNEVKEIMQKPVKEVYVKPSYVQRKRKKNKKDKFAGLNRNIVVSVTPQYTGHGSEDFIPLETTPKIYPMPQNQQKKRPFMGHQRNDKINKYVPQQSSTKPHKVTDTSYLKKADNSKKKKQKNKYKIGKFDVKKNTQKLNNLRNILTQHQDKRHSNLLKNFLNSI